MDKNHDEQVSGDAIDVQPGRREALLRIGKYGAYVAPAVLALVLGKKAEALCSGSLC